jgi:hypothetical protein
MKRFCDFPTGAVWFVDCLQIKLDEKTSPVFMPKAYREWLTVKDDTDVWEEPVFILPLEILQEIPQK